MTPLQIAQEELNKVKVWHKSAGRYAQIKLPVDIVLTIVKHLKSGRSMYKLRQQNIVAINTIRKVRDAWKAGSLDKVIEIAGSPEIQELLENEHLTHFRSIALEDARSALDDVYPAAYSRHWEWDLRHLKEIGLSSKEGLWVLKRHDELAGTMYAAQTTRRNAKGLDTYVSLHYQVVFKIQFPEAPFRYIYAAADIYTRGLLESERRHQPLATDGTTSSGKDMLRYEIWEGKGNIDSYFEALERYKLSPTRIYDLKEQIKRLTENDNG